MSLPSKAESLGKVLTLREEREYVTYKKERENGDVGLVARTRKEMRGEVADEGSGWGT